MQSSFQALIQVQITSAPCNLLADFYFHLCADAYSTHIAQNSPSSRQHLTIKPSLISVLRCQKHVIICFVPRPIMELRFMVHDFLAALITMHTSHANRLALIMRSTPVNSTCQRTRAEAKVLHHDSVRTRIRPAGRLDHA
jgi:hypothetical protein